jgi:hypothetical protein
VKHLSGQSQQRSDQQRYDHRRAEPGGGIARRAWCDLTWPTAIGASWHRALLTIGLTGLLAGCAGAAGPMPATSPVAAGPMAAADPTADTRPENAAPALTGGLTHFAPSPAASATGLAQRPLPWRLCRLRRANGRTGRWDAHSRGWDTPRASLPATSSSLKSRDGVCATTPTMPRWPTAIPHRDGATSY